MILCNKCIKAKGCKIIPAVKNLQSKSHTLLMIRLCKKFKKKPGKKLLKKFFTKIGKAIVKFTILLLKKSGAAIMRLGDRLENRKKKIKK